MPDISGIDVLRAIPQKGLKVKVILFTSFGQRGAAAKLGRTAFL